MRAYYELPYDTVDLISQQVYHYLQTEATLTIQKPDFPWNYLDKKSVLDASPELLNFFKLYKLLPRDISATVCYDDLELHIDALPVYAKVNIPVNNTKNSVNYWYSISKEDFQSLPLITDHVRDGQVHEDISKLPKEKLTLIAEYHNMINPIVFNSRIPHEVKLLGDAITPRIVLSCTFHNEPIHYLR